MRKPSPTRLLVITGDHGVSDATKFSGGYTEDDLRLHQVMVDALRSLDRFESMVCNDHDNLVSALESKPDLVLNFCDAGYQNQATQELHIPALLEMHGLAYTGAPPSAMVLCYDKPVVNLLAASLGIDVPREFVLAPEASLPDERVPLPAIIKPAMGDGSVGINTNAVVRDRAELARQVDWFRATLPGRALLIQEYLPGPEFGLGLLGNPGCFSALPMLQVDFSALPDELPPILAFESKTGPENPYDHVRVVPASLDAEQVAGLTAQAKRLFERLGCRDYARFDFRTGADGRIRLMEVNPNPAWSCEAKLAKMAGFEGMDYPTLLATIIDAAWARQV